MKSSQIPRPPLFHFYLLRVSVMLYAIPLNICCFLFQIIQHKSQILWKIGHPIDSMRNQTNLLCQIAKILSSHQSYKFSGLVPRLPVLVFSFLMELKFVDFHFFKLPFLRKVMFCHIFVNFERSLGKSKKLVQRKDTVFCGRQSSKTS